MRTIATFVLSICLAMPLTAGATFTSFSTWRDAQAEASKQNKFLFVDAMTDWCGWCKVMDKQTFSDSAVAAVLNKEFVCTKVEMETDWGIDLAMKYRVTSFPQFLVFSPNGTLVYRIVGYNPPAEFLEQLARAQAPSTQQHSPGISADINLPWPSFLRESFAKGKARVMPTTEVVAAWLDKQERPTAEVPFTVLVKFNLTSKWNQWVIDNQAELERLYGMEATEKVFSIAMERGTQAIKQHNSEHLKAAIATLPRNHPNYQGASTYLITEEYLAKNGWKGALAYLKSKQEAGDLSANMANEYCWRAYEETMDHDACLLAAEIMEKADKGTDYALWDTYAAVLFKTGKRDRAADAARTAITYGKASGTDVSSTQALLKEIDAKP